MPKGGARVGAGRHTQDKALAALHGSRLRTPTGPALPAMEPVTMPADLPEDQQAVWQHLAPLAMKALTLTPQTAGSFRDLCRTIVVRDGIFAKIQDDGWTFVAVRTDSSGSEHQELKKHPLISDLRGWEQRVEAGRARFRLAPFGKEMVSAPKVEDPFEEFDDTPQ